MAAFGCVVIFAMAAAHCAFDIQWLYIDNRKAAALLQYAESCMFAFNTTQCTFSIELSELTVSSANVCWSSTLLLVNVSIRNHVVHFK